MVVGPLVSKGYNLIGVYEKSFNIEVSHCDCFGRLKVSELFKFMQECAMNHAEEMGVGMSAMHKSKTTFVLSRMKINIYDMPSIGDSVAIKTYPIGMERLFYLRGFEISFNGNKMAEAISMWLVINLETRRPVRERAIREDFPYYKNGDLNIERPDRPRVSESAPDLLVKKVGYSDVDILRHANNSCYVAWTCDCLGSEFFKNNPKYSIIINYSSELSEGECVKIIGEDMTFGGFNESGRESFSAKLERL